MQEYSRFAEAVSSNALYHYSNAWREILGDQVLSSSEIDSWEHELITKAIGADAAEKFTHFISFARSLNNTFIADALDNGATFTVVFEFDARRLKRDHKIVPVSFYAPKNFQSDRVIAKGYTETEERLITNRPGIPLKDYMTAVHIYNNEESNKLGLHEIEVQLDNLTASEKRLASGQSSVYTQEEINAFRKSLMGRRAEINDVLERLNMVAGKASRLYPTVPMWLYVNKDAFIGARWAEAEQLNLNLADTDDDEEF